LKINKSSEDKPKNPKQTYEGQERKPEEKASHSAKEWIAAHIAPALRRPFFVFRPPRRTMSMGKASVRSHKIISA